MSGHPNNWSTEPPTECGRTACAAVSTLEDKLAFRRELVERMMRFAGAVGRFLRELPYSPTRENLRGQLARSASSIGANFAESAAAESARDFVHKLSIALKEAEETRFWLGAICAEFEELSCKAEPLRDESMAFVKILQKSITTAKKGLK